MILNTRVWLLLLAVSLVFLQGCFEYEDVEFKGVKNVSLVERTEKILKIQVDVLVDNPNKFNIKVKKSTLDIYLNDKYVGKTTLDDKIVLKKKSEEIYAVVLNADAKSILKAAMGSLGGFLKGTVDIRIKGKVKGSVYGISKSVDVDMTEQVNLKEFL